MVTFVVERTDERDVKPSLPGQYVTIKMPMPDGVQQPRQYSLTRADDGLHRQFAVKRVHGLATPDGEMSTLLHDDVQVGDEVVLSAPFGDVVLEYTDRPLVLASAGIGITPMAGMLSHLVKSGSRRQVMLLHADDSEESFPLRAQVTEDLAKLADGTLNTWFLNPAEGGKTSGVRVLRLHGRQRRGPAATTPSTTSAVRCPSCSRSGAPWWPAASGPRTSSTRFSVRTCGWLTSSRAAAVLDGCQRTARRRTTSRTPPSSEGAGAQPCCGQQGSGPGVGQPPGTARAGRLHGRGHGCLHGRRGHGRGLQGRRGHGRRVDGERRRRRGGSNAVHRLADREGMRARGQAGGERHAPAPARRLRGTCRHPVDEDGHLGAVDAAAGDRRRDTVLAEVQPVRDAGDGPARGESR